MANSHVLLGVNPGASISEVIQVKKISEIVIPCRGGVNLISSGTSSSSLLNVENKEIFYFEFNDDHLNKIDNVKLALILLQVLKIMLVLQCLDRIVVLSTGTHKLY